MMLRTIVTTRKKDSLLVELRDEVIGGGRRFPIEWTRLKYGLQSAFASATVAPAISRTLGGSVSTTQGFQSTTPSAAIALVISRT